MIFVNTNEKINIMNKLTKLLILIGFLLSNSTRLFAASVTIDIDNLQYTVDTETGQAELYGPVGHSIDNLTIPDYIEYNGEHYPVTTIRENAFRFCPYITGSLTIGNSITTIGDEAFSNCHITGSLTIPNSVTSIGDYAFSSCNFTGSLTIPNSVTSIGKGAFYNCIYFTGSLTLPNSVTTIEDYTFDSCRFTGPLTIPNSVTTIGMAAFAGCRFTGSLIIPNLVTTIGGSAFEWTEIESLYLPSSLIILGGCAFWWCDNLNKIECEAKKPPVTGGSQYGIFTNENFINLYVPAESLNLYKTAKEWKDFKYINPIGGGSVESITLNTTSCTLMIGNDFQLEASILPENVNDKTIEWKSSNKEIAYADENGMVTAYSVGVATITATCGEVSATCKVTVIPVPADRIKLNVKDLTLQVGECDKLVATVVPSNTTDPSIIWRSDNERVASVTADGTVTAIAAGVANITATCGEVSATCKVTVEPDVVRPETPTAFKRKGDGRSCTFVVMMNLSNEELTEQGYKFVYGYTDNTGMDNVIANTPLRYCHTSEQIYNDPSNNFWVFAYQINNNGSTVYSGRRYLDGRVDMTFNGNALIDGVRSDLGVGNNPENWIKPTAKGAEINIVSDESSVICIYSSNGLMVHHQEYEAGLLISEKLDNSVIASGLYIITVKSGSEFTSKKIIIK